MFPWVFPCMCCSSDTLFVLRSVVLCWISFSLSRLVRMRKKEKRRKCGEAKETQYTTHTRIDIILYTIPSSFYCSVGTNTLMLVEDFSTNVLQQNIFSNLLNPGYCPGFGSEESKEKKKKFHLPTNTCVTFATQQQHSDVFLKA